MAALANASAAGVASWMVLGITYEYSMDAFDAIADRAADSVVGRVALRISDASSFGMRVGLVVIFMAVLSWAMPSLVDGFIVFGALGVVAAGGAILWMRRHERKAKVE